MQFEIKLQETKLKLQEDLLIKAGNQKSSAETSVGEAKLPKLVITKLMELTPTGRDSGVNIPKLLTKLMCRP